MRRLVFYCKFTYNMNPFHLGISCVKFDDSRIVTSSYDKKVKVINDSHNFLILFILSEIVS